MSPSATGPAKRRLMSPSDQVVCDRAGAAAAAVVVVEEEEEEEDEADRIQIQKQGPHTKMCGINHRCRKNRL